MNKDFNRRIYTPQTFRRDIAEVFTHMDELRDAHRSGRVGKAFAERIMLAVTNVNQCRYCSYGHTRAALAAGVPEDQIRNLMAGEFDKLPEDEVLALTFAQHYAESGGNPDPEALSRLVDTYGEATAQDILAYIRMITFGNLSGNTLDAFLSRLKFNPAPGSSLTQELGVLLGAFVIIPVEFFKAKTNTRKKTLSSV